MIEHGLKGEQLEAHDAVVSFVRSDARRESYFSLRGRAGTGKTYTMAQILKQFPRESICVCAVSHKAKNQLYGKCRQPNITPLTVASLLQMTMNYETGEFKPDFDEFGKEPVIEKFTIIAVDESSMIPLEIHNAIMERKLPGAAVIYMGDSWQIRPIGKDYDKPNKLSPTLLSQHTYTLTQRVRQGSGHPILEASDVFGKMTEHPHPVIKGVQLPNKVNDKGGIFFHNHMRETILINLPLYKRAVRDGDTNVIKTIVFTNKRKNTINQAVRKLIFGDSVDELIIGDLMIFNNNYRAEEVNNNYDFDDPTVINKTYKSADNSEEFILTDFEEIEITFNNVPEGLDIENTWRGYIIDGISNDLTVEGHQKPIRVPIIAPELVDDFKNMLTRIFKYANGLPKQTAERKKAFMAYNSIRDEVADVSHGYAMTSHKAQGSTYETTIVDIKDMLSSFSINQHIASMIYTGMTRGSKDCYMIHEKFTPTLKLPIPETEQLDTKTV